MTQATLIRLFVLRGAVLQDRDDSGQVSLKYDRMVSEYPVENKNTVYVLYSKYYCIGECPICNALRILNKLLH